MESEGVAFFWPSDTAATAQQLSHRICPSSGVHPVVTQTGVAHVTVSTCDGREGRSVSTV